MCLNTRLKEALWKLSGRNPDVEETKGNDVIMTHKKQMGKYLELRRADAKICKKENRWHMKDDICELNNNFIIYF